MKTCLRVICIGLTLLCTVFGSSHLTAQEIGGGLFTHAGIQPGMADLHLGWPGRIWVQVNIADQGLGYEGSYVTLGAKQHLFQDFLDGRWLIETKGHYDPEYEGFFGNLGIERVFSLYDAGAEVSTGFWIDHDATEQAHFAHPMTALGLNMSIETRRWGLHGNGYFPVGDINFNQADPLNGGCFLGNSIVTVAGIDSALQGFDALLEFKPLGLGHVNGKFGVGGYAYNSDLVESFGGIRFRSSMQFDGGMIVSAEVNHDNRFDVTGALQLGWLFGAGARGTEYGLLGTDLEPTIRNDHVVRFQQDVQLAIDPDTGLAYNVIHVNNLVTPGGDGSVERPFDTLAAAEIASGTDDIIFVRPGGGTTRNMDMGITLQDGQLLLGAGVEHLIPLADGTNFVLCNSQDGNRPTITNIGVGNAIDLANRNTVRGFVIDGTTGGMQNGIAANSGATLTDGIIEDVTITSPIVNGVFLNNIAGDWTFSRNDIQNAGNDGVFITNATDTSSVFTFENNIASNNGIDGIHFDGFDAATMNFTDNETDSNGRDGIFLENHNDTLGIGTNIRFVDSQLALVVPNPANPSDPTAENNGRNGIALQNVSGNVEFFNMEIRGNLNAGISLVDVTTPGADQRVFIGTAGGNSLFDNNGVGTGAGIFNDLGVVNGVQQLFITDTLITDTVLPTTGSGIISQATATSANLRTDIVDNIGILNNATDGIQLNASGGATHTALVANTTGTALPITNSGGNGIAINATTSGPISLVEVDIQNVNITNSGNAGISSIVSGNGQAIVRTSNTTINTAGDGVQINANNTSLSGVSEYRFDGITMLNIVDDGFDLDILGLTFVDFELLNSNLDNSVLTGGDHGIEVNITGDALAAIESRLRMRIVGNTINGFEAGDGIGINAAADAHVLALIDANNITNNGGNAADATPNLLFGDGIDIVADGDSEVFTLIVNNNITGQGEQGLDLNTLSSGEITALVEGNNITNNDLGEDGAVAGLEGGFSNIQVDNAVGGDICLAMNNNFFVMAPVTTDAVLNNLSGPANFTFEQGTNTGDIVFLPGIGAFSVTPFGIVCETAITAEEAAFAGSGFPPLP